MKKLFATFFLLSIITVGFGIFVFKSNNQTFSLKKNQYLKYFGKIEKQFAKEIRQTENGIYDSFLQDQLNTKVIEGILNKRLTTDKQINFVKTRDDLINFSILDENKKLLYQIKQSKERKQYNSFNNEKKIFNTDNNLIIFQIPYEKNFLNGILIFEFNAHIFLELALEKTIHSFDFQLLKLPQLIVVDESPNSNNRELTKKIVNNRLRDCLITKETCDIFINPLQKRLIVDSKKYSNLATAFLYPSNPVDIPRESILILFVLFILTALNILMIFYHSLKKKRQKDQTGKLEDLPLNPPPPPDILARSESTTIKRKNSHSSKSSKPISNSLTESETTDFPLEKDSSYTIDSTLADDSSEEDSNTNEDDVLKTTSEIFNNKSDRSTIPADEKISSLHKEINTPLNKDKDTINQVNQNLKEVYKKLSFTLIKNFFPKLNKTEVEKSLTDSPHADNLILLQLKQNRTYEVTESFNVDSYTQKNCKISQDHPLIRDYLDKRKGLLIRNLEKNESLSKEIFSVEEHKKIKSLFMFSFNINSDKFIFLIY